YTSLGAGNTGKPFDLETDRRVAEFIFTNWWGGPESIRQNEIFKDFYHLAEFDTPKTRYLYVLETTHPLKFLRGGRSIFGKSGVVSKNQSLRDAFLDQYGTDRFTKVRDYYEYRQARIQLVGVATTVPELAGMFQAT